jgi:Ca2+-binding RTX toxin-like protein
VVDAASQIERILLGKANDTVAFASGASVPGTIDGGLGVNSLDYSAYTTSVVVDLSTGTATGTVEVSSFSHVTGGSANDTITGDDTVNILDGRSGDDSIHGAGGDDFLIGGPATLADSLHGDSGNDTYIITSTSTSLVLHETGGSVSNGFASIGGTDTIDLTALTGSATLNLTLSSPQLVTITGPTIQLDQPEHFENVLGSSTASNILTGNSADNLLVGGSLSDTINGGAGDDILVGLGATDSLNGQSGHDIVLGGAANDSSLIGGADRDLIIGGSGQDTLDGQLDDDILIGGTTNYDDPLDPTQLAALLSLRLEWISSTKSYTTRVNNLTTGVGAGNYKLTTGISGTVQDDSVADMIFGGAGTDLFFSLPPDLSDKNPPTEAFAIPIDGLDEIVAALAERTRVKSKGVKE